MAKLRYALRPHVALLALLALLHAPGAAAQQGESQDDADAAAPAASWAPGARPNPGLWLVIDDGRGPRLVASHQSGAVAPLLEAAAAAGLQLAMPQGGGEEDDLALAAAWEGDRTAASGLQGRYGSGELVTGRLFRSGSGWRTEWQVLDGLGDWRRWTDEGADARALLARIGEGAARHLAQRSQELAGAGGPQRVTVLVEGLDSAADWLRLRAWLDGLAVVRGHQALSADGNRLELQLELAAGIGRFDELAAAGGLLTRDGDRDGHPRYRFD